jgi:replicative DNA helicase
MVQEKKRASYDTVRLAEYRLLNALAKNPAYIEDPRVSVELFVDEPAKSAYNAIIALVEQKINITPASLWQAASNIDYHVDQRTVQCIWNIDSEGASSLDDILGILKTAQLKNNLLDKVDDLKEQLEQPGDLDGGTLLSNIYGLDEMLQKSSRGDSPLISFSEWADMYIEDLKLRKAGRKYSYGDPLLDEYLYKGAYPGAITMICAGTNMGKSTYVLSLINNLLENNQPCMYLSLEMSGTDTMDRLISMRCGIPNEELYNPDPTNIDHLIDLVEKEKQALLNRKNFMFCEDPDIDMPKLRKLIKEFKQRSKSDYCLVAIDLLTQMKNFMSSKNNSNTATAMEIAMNDLNALAKSENVHIVGVAQLNRETDNVKIRDLQDIEDCRPNLASIKNSGALAERSRVVLVCFRNRFFIDRYLQDDEQAQAQPDIMDVQVLKNSNGPSGKKLKYMFDSDHFKLLPLADEEQAKLDSLREIDF